MTDKDVTKDSLSEDQQFENYLERLKNQTLESQEKDDKKSSDMEEQEKTQKDEESSQDRENGEPGKLSDEEKDSISLKKEEEEEFSSGEELTNEESAEKKVDNKHIRHSAFDDQDERDDAMVRERTRKMRFTNEEVEEEIPPVEEEEIDEEEARIAEMQAKKEQERLEKEFRQQQFREANERALVYQEHARIANEEYRRTAAIREQNKQAAELAEREAQEAIEGEKTAGLGKQDEKPLKKDEWIDDYLKQVTDQSKAIEGKPDELFERKLKLKGAKELEEGDEDEVSKLQPNHAQASLSKRERDGFAQDLARTSTGVATSVDGGNKEPGSVFESKVEKSPSDTFGDDYFNKVTAKGLGDTSKKEDVAREKDPLEGSLKTKEEFDIKKVDPEEISKELTGQAQSLVQSAGPTMGQDSPEADESKKKSNAKKVAKTASKLMQEGTIGKELTIDGVAVQLTKDGSIDPSNTLTPLKGQTLNSVIGQALDINDRKSAEENTRTTIQRGITALGKKAEDGKLATGAEKLLHNLDENRIGDAPKDTFDPLKADRAKATTIEDRAPTKLVRELTRTNNHAAHPASASTASSTGVSIGGEKTVTSGLAGKAPEKVGNLTEQLDNASPLGAKGGLVLNRFSGSKPLTPKGGSVRLGHGEGVNSTNALKNVQDSGLKTSLSGRSVSIGRAGLAKGGEMASQTGSATSAFAQHAGAVATIAGQMMKPTSSEDSKEMNPTSIAKSAKQVFGGPGDVAKQKSSSIVAKGIVASGSETSVSAQETGKNAGSKLNQLAKNDPFGKKGAERQIFSKSDGSLRMVREGHESGLKEIKPDAPGLAKQEANKKLLNGRDQETKAKFKDVKKDASQEYREATKTKDGSIRLTRKGAEPITKEGTTPGNAVNKFKSKNDALMSKFKSGPNSKMSAINVGRGARVSTKGGALVEQAKEAQKAGAVIRKYWAKNGLATAAQTTQTAQANVIAKVVAKKAAATVAITGISGGAIAGGAGAMRQMGAGGDFAVIAASVYADEVDDTPLTQDAVDMLQARLNAYAMQAQGKDVSAADLKKAGGDYVPVPNLGVQKTVNGKPVTSFTSNFKFVDRDGKNISKDYFLLDERSDLIMPSEGIGGTGGFGSGSGGEVGPTDTGHPLNVPYVITQGFHQFAALDLAAPQGSPIFAIADGEVLEVNATSMHINGNYLIQSLPSGEMVYYGHMVAPPLASTGDRVTKGQHIGYVGMTGLATGPHIHFDLRQGNLWSPGDNPYKLLPGVPNGAVGITVDPATFKSPDAPASSSSSSSSSGSKNEKPSGTDNSKQAKSGTAKRDENGQTQMDIMFNIVGALETGGQVYGQRDYANFINVEAGAEVTATLGWSSFYGVNGKQYLQRFKQENPDLFAKLDEGGQVDPVLSIEWEATGWQANPTQKASIVNMLTTDQGRKLQDSMTAERLAKHWKKAASLYTDNMRAIAWYTNIAELAGEGVADPFFESLGGNYDSDHIYNTLIGAWNRGGATIGAPMYHRRHALYKQWIEENFGPDDKVDLDNIEVTGAGRIDAGGGGNPNSTGDTRAGQTLLIKVILSMAATGSHYGLPNKEEDFFKYCIAVLDNAMMGKNGDGIQTSYTEGDETASASTQFKVLTDMYELETMEKNFKSWDLTDETYGDKNPQAYIALPNDDFEEIFNIKIRPIALGSPTGSKGGYSASGIPYVKWALEVANNPAHGYSQVRRQGNPDYDCSSFVWYALDQAGFDVGTWAFATPTMPSTLQAAGFTMHPTTTIEDLQPGDILLNDGHTEIYIGDGKTVGAHADEIGGIVGAQGGDQGISTMGGIGEISEIPLTDVKWYNWYFRPPADYMEQHSGSESSSGAKGDVVFESNGLLKMQQSDAAQVVINNLMAIPGHSNGARFHKEWGIDEKIDKLSTEEAIWVLWRIEGAGFGQTGAGLAGSDNPTSHKALVDQQLNGRFNGSIHELLKHWGTYNYGGY